MAKKLMFVIVAAALGITVGAGLADTVLDDNRILTGGKMVGTGTEGKHAGQVTQSTPGTEALNAYLTLKGGKRGYVKNNRMFIIEADGKQSPAKDGTYELMDGRKIRITNGMAIIDVN